MSTPRRIGYAVFFLCAATALANADRPATDPPSQRRVSFAVA